MTTRQLPVYAAPEHRPDTSVLLPLPEYDRIVVAFSGGKDSLALVLDLLERGVPREQIVLWHHRIDGGPGSEVFMDWPVTDAYCRAVANALGIEIRFSWKDGGFKGEMLRKDARTRSTTFETDAGDVRITVGGTRGKQSTRMLFPQVSADLRVRWCSAYLKIDVAAKVFNNDPAYKQGRFLLLTGERREESTARSRYATVEKHGTTNSRRRVDQWRSILEWTEADVWAIMERWSINPHPAYHLGWSRLSCRTCIFGQADQWAAVKDIAPETFEEIAQYETEFGKTIQRDKSVRELAAQGTSYVDTEADAPMVAMANAEQFHFPVTTQWVMPRGAFAGRAGPS